MGKKVKKRKKKRFYPIRIGLMMNDKKCIIEYKMAEYEANLFKNSTKDQRQIILAEIVKNFEKNQGDLF